MSDRLFREPLLRTPFHARTEKANLLNEWAPWGGYTTVLAYEDVTGEYTAIRNAASLYDLSPMVKYAVEGRDAEAYLNRLCIRDVRKLQVGQVHYTAWCDDEGKVLDDGTLFRFAPDRFRICCQERHLPWLLDSAEGFDVSVREITTEVAALSLQGPTAFSVLDAAGWGGASALKPFRMAEFDLDGTPVVISRTGFTGDLGYELWTTPDKALALWDRLMETGRPSGIRPIGTKALDMARIEAGFIITNMDFVAGEQALRLDRRRSPFEIGLEWMVDFKKGHFNGRRALLAEREGNTSRFALVGLDIEGNVPAAQSLVYHGKRREVGIVTAGIWSPSAKRNLALASLQRRYGAPGTGDLWVEIYALRELAYSKLMVRARICERPFFDPPRRRASPPQRF